MERNFGSGHGMPAHPQMCTTDKTDDAIRQVSSCRSKLQTLVDDSWRMFSESVCRNALLSFVVKRSVDPKVRRLFSKLSAPQTRN